MYYYNLYGKEHELSLKYDVSILCVHVSVTALDTQTEFCRCNAAASAHSLSSCCSSGCMGRQIDTLARLDAGRDTGPANFIRLSQSVRFFARKCISIVFNV